MKKKPYKIQTQTRMSRDEPIRVKILRCDSLEEASLLYSKILKRANVDNISLSINGDQLTFDRIQR